MSLFMIDLLFRLVKVAVDKADLELLRSPIPTDEYDFESREITEHLCEGDDAATVDDLTSWLASYWTRQFGPTATGEWLGSRDFRALATELIAYRTAVESPETRGQYLQWQRSPGLGYTATNEELLELVRLWTTRLAERLYQKWAVGAQENDSETEYRHAARSLRRLSQIVGYGEARRAMKQEFLAICLRTDARGFVACLRGEPASGSYSDMDVQTLQMELHDCASLYVESALTLESLDTRCDWEDFTGTSGAHSIN